MFQVQPTLITNAHPSMQITQTDIFAPVLSVIELPNAAALPHALEACPYALTTAIFGDEHEAGTLVSQLRTGTVLINDLIVPTADPRIPFTPRRRSGFGSTRAAEGLLEMTVPRTTTVRRGSPARQYQPTTPDHIPFFQGMVRLTHSGTWSERLAGLRQFITAARKLR